MPGDEDAALLVRGERCAAIETAAAGHEGALGFEAGAVVAEACAEDGAAFGQPRLGFAGAVPDHVHAAATTESELAAADGAHGDRGAGLAVHADRFGPVEGAGRFFAGVEKVAGGGVAFVVEEVRAAGG